jgi:branched-chain amino acid transport system substrate-binding protein
MNPTQRLALCGAFLLPMAAARAQAPEPLKLAYVGPLSGAQAHFGKDSENGVKMAIDDLNARGVAIAGRKVTFVLASEDDGADPKQATTVANKLCDMHVAGVIGHQNSGTAIPASRIYEDCGLPHLTPSATNPQLNMMGHKTSFRMLANDNALGGGVAEFSAKTLKLKRVAVIDDRTAYGQGIASVFKKQALAAGIDIVDEQFTTDKSLDFSSILTTIKSRKPDGIFFGGMDPQAGPMLRQMQQLGLNDVKFMGGDGICTEKLMELSDRAKTVDNVICAEGGASIRKMPKGEAWKKQYDAKFPATMVLVDAMVRAGSADPKVYAPFLFQTDYQGVSARIAFESNGELHNPTMTLFKFVGGKKLAVD